MAMDQRPRRKMHSRRSSHSGAALIAYTCCVEGQNPAALFDEAFSEGEILIRRRGEQAFEFGIQPLLDSLLDVEGVDPNVSVTETVHYIRQGRRGYAHETRAVPSVPPRPRSWLPRSRDSCWRAGPE